MGFEDRESPFGPLLPDCHPIFFNDENCLENITEKTAAVVLETIQGGAGFIEPTNNYLTKVKSCFD